MILPNHPPDLQSFKGMMFLQAVATLATFQRLLSDHVTTITKLSEHINHWHVHADPRQFACLPPQMKVGNRHKTDTTG